MKHLFLFMSAGNKRKSLLLWAVLTFSVMLQAQNIAVQGIVKDVMGEPLPGVNIMEKGTTNGVISDLDGKFTLSVSGTNSVLVVSFVGYASQEVSVKGKRSLSITLKEDAELLDEVVVCRLCYSEESDPCGSGKFGE